MELVGSQPISVFHQKDLQWLPGTSLVAPIGAVGAAYAETAHPGMKEVDQAVCSGTAFLCHFMSNVLHLLFIDIHILSQFS